MIWFLILLKSVVKFPLTSDIPTSPCMKHKDQGSLAPRRLHSSSARLLFAELLQISSSFPTVISYPLVAFGEGSALFLPFSDEERSVPGLLLWPPLQISLMKESIFLKAFLPETSVCSTWCQIKQRLGGAQLFTLCLFDLLY